MLLVFDDWLAETWCFAQSDGSRDNGLIDQAWKVLPNLINHLLAEIGSRVIHRHNDPAYRQALIEGANLIMRTSCTV